MMYKEDTCGDLFILLITEWFRQKTLDLKLGKKLVKCYIWSIALY